MIHPSGVGTRPSGRPGFLLKGTDGVLQLVQPLLCRPDKFDQPWRMLSGHDIEATIAIDLLEDRLHVVTGQASDFGTNARMSRWSSDSLTAGTIEATKASSMAVDSAGHDLIGQGRDKALLP